MKIKTIISDDLTLIRTRIRYYENQMRISLSESIAYERLLAKEEVLKELLAKCNQIENEPTAQNTVPSPSRTDDDLPF